MEALPDRLPLVIGVTGHRDLRDQDLPQLEQEISSVIAGLRRDYLGKNGETPIIVLSSIAEGADRLVARIALELGARLVAPLPMPPEEYRRDFEPGLKPGNVAEFDALLAQAIAAPVMPFAPGNSLGAVRADHKKRAEQYRAVGLFIVQHCDVLIALWDGDDKEMSAGGTAEVVTFKRNGIPLAVSTSARASLDGSEIGPVIQVVTPRQKETSTVREVAVKPWGHTVIKRHRGGAIRRFVGAIAGFVGRMLGRPQPDVRAQLSVAQARELDAWEAFGAVTALTRQFNREAARLAAETDGPARTTRNLDGLFGRTDEPPAVDPATAKELALVRAPRWCRLYAIADTLAQEWQAQFRWDWLAIFVAGFFAFLCFTLFPEAGSASDYVLAAYLLGFLAIFFVRMRAYLGGHQERFLDYRALAEALRVAVFWKLLGIGVRHIDDQARAGGQPIVEAEPFASIAEAYPIEQTGELAWVKASLRALELPDATQPELSQPLDPTAHAIARYYWVEGQSDYFRRQSFRLNRVADRLGSNAIVLLSLTPFVIVPCVILLTSPTDDIHGGSLRGLLLILSGILPGIGAFMAGYSEKLAFKVRARHFDRIRTLYERACDLLPPTPDERTAPLARTLYVALGIEAMRENGEWVAIYRQRPIQPPQ